MMASVRKSSFLIKDLIAESEKNLDTDFAGGNARLNVWFSGDINGQAVPSGPEEVSGEKSLLSMDSSFFERSFFKISSYHYNFF